VPVRSRVLGAECLAEALGPDAPPADLADSRPGNGRRTLAGIAFAVAALSTVLPWSSVGEGAGPFGAWGRSPRWSLLAAGAAVAGLLLWLALRRRGSSSAAGDTALAVLAGLVVTGSLLAAARPPYAAHVSAVPLIAAFAGTIALVASVAARVEHARRSGQRV
jgi:hypothetical protein